MSNILYQLTQFCNGFYSISCDFWFLILYLDRCNIVTFAILRWEHTTLLVDAFFIFNLNYFMLCTWHTALNVYYFHRIFVFHGFTLSHRDFSKTIWVLNAQNILNYFCIIINVVKFFEAIRFDTLLVITIIMVLYSYTVYRATYENTSIHIEF